MNYWKLNALMESGRVTRMHATQTIGKQTVAEHTYGAMVIATELLAAHPEANKLNVLTALLYHDAPEVETGDVPANIKKDYPEVEATLKKEEDAFYAKAGIYMEKLTDLEKKIVLAADRLDLAYFLINQRRLGCRLPIHQTIFQRVLDYVRVECGEQMSEMGGFLRCLENKWEDANGRFN